MIPDTRYARTSDGTHVAYQIAGTGPVDIVFAPGPFSCVRMAIVRGRRRQRDELIDEFRRVPIRIDILLPALMT